MSVELSTGSPIEGEVSWPSIRSLWPSSGQWSSSQRSLSSAAEGDGKGGDHRPKPQLRRWTHLPSSVWRKHRPNSTTHSQLNCARVRENDPTFFERLVLKLLVAMGYGGSEDEAAEHLGRGGDGRIDGVINEDRLGLDRIYVQAKRWSDNPVGRPEVQAFVGA